MKNKLFLFDIDGTLISPGPAARESINKAIEEYTGTTPNLQIKDVAGLTDRLIVRNALTKSGKNFNESTVNTIVQKYLFLFEQKYQQTDGAFVYQDSLMLVQKVKANGFNTGLLTGNMRRGAEIKLGKFDLMKNFDFGAFADDGLTRNDLPKAAKQIANNLYNIEYKNEDIVLVGDTPEDATAAKTNDCKSIVVCRREEWYNDIVNAGADLVVKSLDDSIIEERFLS
jgi:phosphoglycolate phosphatase-like HAD superfamily hydrolase